MARHDPRSRWRDLWSWGAIGLGSSGALLGTGAVVLAVDIAPGQGTVLGGLGVLGAAGLTYYASHRTRTSNERIEGLRVDQSDKELKQAQDHFDAQQKSDSDTRAADRAAETSRDLRARFTAAATSLADNSPTIRLAGVYSLVALADDWTNHGNTAERDVCIALLLSYLRAPQVDPDPGDGNASSHLHVRGTIVRQIAERWQRPTEDQHSWRSVTGVTFARCDLRYVDLRNASLDNCDFTLAQMDSVKLADATMTSAKLISATLTDAALVRTDLTNANLRRARCRGAQFRAANLTRATAVSALFKDANFSLSILRRAKLSNAYFDGADFYGVEMQGASLRNARGFGTGDFRENEYDSKTVWPSGFSPPPPSDSEPE